MTGWNLPPGVTDKDIDDAFGDDEDDLRCDQCGTWNASDEDECRNCGARFEEPDDDEEE